MSKNDVRPALELTVVIPTKDTPTLPRALRSVAIAAGHSPETRVSVVVVDSSKRPFRPDGDMGRHLKITVIPKDCSLLAARLLGIERARGDWVLNLDADQWVPPEFFRDWNSYRAPAVVFRETPQTWDRWVSLVLRIRQREEAEFRRCWSLAITVIPRAYRREMLQSAVARICADVGGAMERLPTRHEDTALFSYFLRVNSLSVAEAIDFAKVPIYHPVLPLDETGRKSYRYGRDLGSETRRSQRGELTLDPRVMRDVYRADYARILRLWSPGLGWNVEGLVYDGFRTCFYAPGFLAGYFLPDTK